MQHLGQIGPVGASLQIREINTFVTIMLSCSFFSVTRPGRTVALFALNGSNDMFLPKDGSFGGLNDG